MLPHPAPPTTQVLHIPRAHSREVRIGWAPLLANKAKEYWIKACGRRIKGQGMIGAAPETVSSGFASLQDADFDEYNLPQAWVESRMIPQVLHQRVSSLGARVIDLGCGPATSTRLIAHFADPSWEITGYDLVPHFVEAARDHAARGDIRNRAGHVLRPSFVCQDISQPLRCPLHHAGRSTDRAPASAARPPHFLDDHSIDLAIAGGVVGLYMGEAPTRRLAAELRRVLRPGAYAALDAGPAVPAPLLARIMQDQGFTHEATIKSFWIEPRPKLVFRASAGSPRAR